MSDDYGHPVRDFCNCVDCTLSRVLRERDSLLAEVERQAGVISRLEEALGDDSLIALQHIASLEADNAQLLAHLEEAKLWVTDAATRARMVALCDEVRGAVNNGAVHNVSTESAPEGASVDPATQHCAKCGGVECHALAGLFCGEHSYEGCGEWGGCPICENAKLKSALAAAGRGE